METNATLYSGKFESERYLEHYYAPTHVTEDEVHVLKYCTNFVKSHGTFDHLLEIGCGPTIHHVAPFAEAVRCVTMTDYLETNLEKALAWVENPESHDWSPYLMEVLRNEGAPESAYAAKVATIQRKVRNFFVHDVLDNRIPQLAGRQYDLVTSFFCAENASTSHEDWRAAMKNIMSFVQPDGYLVIAALRNTPGYRVGETFFPGAIVTEEFVYSALSEGGFAEIDVQVGESASCEEKGFSSVIMASGRKLFTQKTEQ